MRLFAHAMASSNDARLSRNGVRRAFANVSEAVCLSGGIGKSSAVNGFHCGFKGVFHALAWYALNGDGNIVCRCRPHNDEARKGLSMPNRRRHIKTRRVGLRQLQHCEDGLAIQIGTLPHNRDCLRILVIFRRHILRESVETATDMDESPSPCQLHEGHGGNAMLLCHVRSDNSIVLDGGIIEFIKRIHGISITNP